jgi:hypothetical protein
MMRSAVRFDQNGVLLNYATEITHAKNSNASNNHTQTEEEMDRAFLTPNIRLNFTARRELNRLDRGMSCRREMMSKRFKVGDHVRWNSEAGHVSGRIIKVHTRDTDYKGYTHHASPEDPQYEIKSDKTDHIAMHKGSALRKVAN